MLDRAGRGDGSLDASCRRSEEGALRGLGHGCSRRRARVRSRRPRGHVQGHEGHRRDPEPEPCGGRSPSRTARSVADTITFQLPAGGGELLIKPTLLAADDHRPPRRRSVRLIRRRGRPLVRIDGTSSPGAARVLSRTSRRYRPEHDPEDHDDGVVGLWCGGIEAPGRRAGRGDGLRLRARWDHRGTYGQLHRSRHGQQLADRRCRSRAT